MFYYALTLLFVAVDLLQKTRVIPSRTKGLTSDLSQVAGSAARVQEMLTTVLAYIEDVLVSTKVNWKDCVTQIKCGQYVENCVETPPDCIPGHLPATPCYITVLSPEVISVVI